MLKLKEESVEDGSWSVQVGKKEDSGKIKDMKTTIGLSHG